MLLSTLILFHICAAVFSLISGTMAMMLRKGSSLHAAAGNVFFVSMVSMTTSALYLALFLRPNAGNVMGGALTLYMVLTAWVAARRREVRVGAFDYAMLVMALAIAVAGATWGVEAANSPRGIKDHYPAPLFFIFGSIALLFAISDLRILFKGGVSGAQRIARHLWRMGLGFFMAVLSFYPGNARLLPQSWRDSGLMFVPHLLLAASLIYWRIKVARRRRAQQTPLITPQPV